MMAWDKKSPDDMRTGRDQPSELGLFAGNIMQQNTRYLGDIDILDLGCGNGRNAFYLAEKLKCHILGIDKSEGLIAIARETCPKELANRIEFLCYDFSMIMEKYDMIFAANLYHSLKPDERVKFRETIRRCLKRGGWLFLNTLSVNDLPGSSRISGVEMEVNPGQDEKHHLSSREELEHDFGFLHISALFEREHSDNHSSGEAHRQISWILYGVNQRPGIAE